MTAFAINSGGTEYYDQKTGGSTNATLDGYTISNGSTLVVRTDTYACLNHSTAFGSLDNVSFSGIGGEVIVDPTYVRHVAYTGGSGNSPAFGATISQGGVSGVFLGAWVDWQSEPIVPGAAIPAAGFIKIGGVTGGAFSAGALTGIAATCAGADVQSWIEVRGADTATITVPRVGEFSTVGAWFDLGVTDGNRGQILACPTTGSIAGIFPGIWIESAPGSNVYERYAGVGTLAASTSHPTDIRGKWVWQTTSGIRIGSDGTNNAGYLPASGCKVRIPAAILTCCTRSGSGSGPRVVPNATLTTRMKFATTASGAIDIKTVVMQWYAALAYAYTLSIVNSAISDTVLITNIPTTAVLDDCIVSPTQLQTQSPLNVQACDQGINVFNSSFLRIPFGTTANVGSITTSIDVVVSGCVFGYTSARLAPQSIALSMATVVNSEVSECIIIGAKLGYSACVGGVVSEVAYADGLVDTTTSNAVSAVDLSGGCRDFKIENISILIPNSHPYNALINISNSYDVVVRNIGTYAAPIDGGSVNPMQRLLNALTSCVNIKMQRCYAINTRTDLFSASSSVRGFEVSNCAGDYADQSAVNAILGILRGIGESNATTGRTAVYGTHWADRFTSATQGMFEVLCNEPISETLGQCQIVSGAPKFNSVGSVLMTAVGQQIIWELPYFAIGHTALANSALTITGTNTGNLSYEFQYDLGSGYNGTWLTANATNFTGVGAIDPAFGIKIKLRVTCVTANTSNVLTNIRIATVTTSTAQSTNLYPLSYAPISVSGLTSGSRVKFSKVSDGSILYSAQESSGVVNFNDNVYVGAVAIEARNASSAPYYLPWVTQVVTVDGQNTSAIALQQLD